VGDCGRREPKGGREKEGKGNPAAKKRGRRKKGLLSAGKGSKRWSPDGPIPYRLSTDIRGAPCPHPRKKRKGKEKRERAEKKGKKEGKVCETAPSAPPPSISRRKLLLPSRWTDRKEKEEKRKAKRKKEKEGEGERSSEEDDGLLSSLAYSAPLCATHSSADRRGRGEREEEEKGKKTSREKREKRGGEASSCASSLDPFRPFPVHHLSDRCATASRIGGKGRKKKGRRKRKKRNVKKKKNERERDQRFCHRGRCP